jgi:hypothetical protein
MAGKAETRAPGSVREAQGRYGWNTRDIAQRFNVSGRTARRWVQQDRIPARRAEQFRAVVRAQAAAGQRRQIEARGLSGLRVTGIYRVSANRYRARSNAAVRIMPGGRISGSTMREVFRAVDEGRGGEAERMMSDALTRAYGASSPVRFEDVDSLSYRVR